MSRQSSYVSEKESEKESRDNSLDLEQGKPDPAWGRISIIRPISDASQQPLQYPTDWDGPDDRENPWNWPLWQRCFHTFIPAGIALVCTLASSIYVPGRREVQQTMGVSSEVSILPYSLYVLGLAFGPMIAAPLSETFGRRDVYRLAIPIFALFILGSGFSNNIASLTICRFLAGVFGSPGLSIGAATISDVWPPAKRAVPMAMYVTTPFLGPALGPLLGGYGTTSFDWRWTQWIILFFTVACLTPVIFMKETYKSKILKRRAKKMGITPKGSQRTMLQAAKFFLTSTLIRPLHMGFTEPIVGLFTLYIAVNFAMLYGFFTAFERIMQDVYGFGLGPAGLTFLGLGVGCIVGCIGIILVDRFVFKRQVLIQKEQGLTPKVNPESRLYIAMIGSLLLPVSLFWFGWTARADIHWICPVIAESFFGCGNLLIFMSATLYLTDTYGARWTASAMGSNNLARYIVGCVFPLFTLQMYGKLGIGWATSLFGFISLAMTTIPWVFYFYGPSLRSRTKYRPG